MTRKTSFNGSSNKDKSSPEYVDATSDRAANIINLVVDVGQEIQQYNNPEVSDSPITYTR